ncbi:superoxide dismutase [Agrobacterium tumefaciens]|uniref:superoxide dismutase n=1 Tax=Agrobacterium tumefaciens TaxID=358 RepID=UPI00384BC063
MLISRRTLCVATGAMALATTLSAPKLARATAPFSQPPLPYDEGALSPVISAATVGLHYGRHHSAYFKNLNSLVQGTQYETLPLEEVVKATVASTGSTRKVFNNAAQAWNHNLYWEQFTPGGSDRPSGRVFSELEAAFGGWDGFVREALTTSDNVFGTGWVWLTRGDEGRLELVGYEDANNPMAFDKPAYLGIDLWEHAYYLDYTNRKADHIRATLEKLVNWNIVAGRMGV